MNLILIIGYILFFLSILNLLRFSLFMVGSDIYTLKSHLQLKKRQRKSYPTFSVIIPARNEHKTIVRAASSVLASDYPKEKFEVIVVINDSKDTTFKKVKQLKKKLHANNLKIINIKTSGKANALNRGIKYHAKGTLVMCLDADSYIAPDALQKTAMHFKDKRIIAMAANLKIIDNGSLINLIQRFEYIISYQMKRAQTLLNIEYIIGGIGSTFRRDMLQKIGYYDTDTMTEDIDLTMKILNKIGNKKYKIIYGSDVIAYTEACLSINELIAQRYRWKYGRAQTFFKNRNMFFNPHKRFNRLLTYIYLPYAIFTEITFFLEPLFIGYITYLIFRYGDIFTLITSFTLISLYIIYNLFAEDSIEKNEKLKLLVIAPTMYIFFYALSFVEYIALIKGSLNLRFLPSSINDHSSSWHHVKR